MAENGNGQSLRNSTGKLKATTKGADRVPNYLRASTGSCHDACKFGMKHEFKAIPKRPVKRRSMPNAEIPVEIFLPSDRSTKVVKPSSVVPDASVSTKLDVASSTKSTRPQKASSSTNIRPSHVSEQIDQEARLDVNALSPDLSNSVNMDPSPDVNCSSPDSSKLVQQDSSFNVKSSSPDSSKSVKQESSIKRKASTSFKQESSSSQRHSSVSSKSTLQDVQSRRRSSSSNLSGSIRQSASKPARSPHLTLAAISKTPILGRKSFPPNALNLKPMKGETSSVVGKAPLKNDTSTKLGGGSLKSKSNCVNTEQSSYSSSLVGKNSGNGSTSSIRNYTGSKMDKVSRTSKATSKKSMDSATTSLSLKTRSNLKLAEENSPNSSSIALTPNLPGTKVARLNVRKNITQKEGGSRKGESASEDLNGYSASKEPENEKVPEKTLHVIEVESSQQQSPDESANTGYAVIEPQLQSSPGSFDSVCQSKSPFSSQNAIETNSESEYTESEADDDSASSYSSRRKHGKSRVLGHEGNESAALKVNFKRGKVVDPQSEFNSPRRLRFRRRSSSENEQPETDGVKVVLRHQDVQEKKTEQGLLNVVIGETATKLEEVRKSKVKALVGAFETVISLQESRLSGDKTSSHSSPGR